MWRKKITVRCNLTRARFSYPDIEIDPDTSGKGRRLETRRPNLVRPFVSTTRMPGVRAHTATLGRWVPDCRVDRLGRADFPPRCGRKCNRGRSGRHYSPPCQRPQARTRRRRAASQADLAAPIKPAASANLLQFFMRFEPLGFERFQSCIHVSLATNRFGELRLHRGLVARGIGDE